MPTQSSRRRWRFFARSASTRRGQTRVDCAEAAARVPSDIGVISSGSIFELTGGDVKIEQLFCTADGPWAAEWEHAVLSRNGRTLEIDDHEFAELAYFTSEDAAREGERRELPSDAADRFAEWEQVVKVGRYMDITDP